MILDITVKINKKDTPILTTSFIFRPDNILIAELNEVRRRLCDMLNPINPLMVAND